MSEKIKYNFEQAELVKPLTEVSKQYTPEELAEIETGRAKIERELYKGGARGVGAGFGKIGKVRLVATQEQIRQIHKNGQYENKEQKEKADLETFLWESAELLQQARTDLEKRLTILQVETADMKKRYLNLHEQDILGKKEEEYWQLTILVSNF